MKKYFVFLMFLYFAISCDSGSFNNKNPNIPNYQFSTVIDINLPQYSNLQFASNHAFVAGGARGVVVFNTGSSYNAYELACPNQPYSSCTAPMNVPVGAISATCSCDDTVYSLFNGQCPGQAYPMKQYRVDVAGMILTIYN